MNPDRSLVSITLLPIRSAKAPHGVRGLRSGVEPDDDLDQGHHRHRGKKVQPDDALRQAQR